MGSASQTASQTQPPVTPPALAEHSRFVQRIRRRYADELALLPSGLPRRDTITALVATLRERGRALASALRVARHLVLERLAVLDVEQGCAMEDVTLAMTELAEATLERYRALRPETVEMASRNHLPKGMHIKMLPGVGATSTAASKSAGGSTSVIRTLPISILLPAVAMAFCSKRPSIRSPAATSDSTR